MVVLTILKYYSRENCKIGTYNSWYNQVYIYIVFDKYFLTGALNICLIYDLYTT